MEDENFLKISHYKISVYKVPVQNGMESDGTLEWKATTMVLVEIRAGDFWGLGYTYGHRAIAIQVKDLLQNIVLGQNALNIRKIWEHLRQEVRNDGLFGLSAMAISAIDNALWDLKGHVLNLPLENLLGACRTSIEVYGSGGFTSFSPREMEKQMTDWMDQGLRRFKMKVGRNSAQDSARVRFVRKCIGRASDLMVDANEAYEVKEALLRAEEFAQEKVTWFEQPISCLNRLGMSELRQKLPAIMSLATGEYIYNTSQLIELLRYDCADVIQLDVTRCQGVSGFLQAAALCETNYKKISSHCAPSLHRSLGLTLPGFLHLEYFFDHVRIEEQFFENSLNPENGFLTGKAEPGFGLIPKRSAMKKYQIGVE